MSDCTVPQASARTTGLAVKHAPAEASSQWKNGLVTTSAAHAAAFYREAVREGSVWGIRDDGGIPAPDSNDGCGAMPFWSLRSRAERVIGSVYAFERFVTFEVPLDEFRSRWLTGLERDGLLVGLNWSGSAATGYDVSAVDVERNLANAVRGSLPPE